MASTALYFPVQRHKILASPFSAFAPHFRWQSFSILISFTFCFPCVCINTLGQAPFRIALIGQTGEIKPTRAHSGVSNICVHVQWRLFPLMHRWGLITTSLVWAADMWTVRATTGANLTNCEGGDFAAGILRRGIFRVSNSREIYHTISAPMYEINLLRNLAKFLVQQLPLPQAEHF